MSRARLILALCVITLLAAALGGLIGFFVGRATAPCLAVKPIYFTPSPSSASGFQVHYRYLVRWECKR